jgi:hypothetical protein
MLVAALAATAASCGSVPDASRPTLRFTSTSSSSAVSVSVPMAVAPVAAVVPPPSRPAPSSDTPKLSMPPSTAPPPATAPHPAPAPAPAPTPAIHGRLRWVGFYIPDVPVRIEPLASLESRTGQLAQVAHFFLGVPAEPFATRSAQNAAAMGATPMITLEFWDYHEATCDQPQYSLKRISAGVYDDYLRQFARDASNFDGAVWLRPMHEMNGSWYPWCGTVNGNQPADFVAAWRHIYDVFRDQGADNVKFVWCPEANSSPNTAQNAIASYWPGDGYVDFVALDGYNADGHGAWRSFDSIFGSGYAAVTKLTDKPLFIAETGCTATGGDKAAWIRDMFRRLPSAFPRVDGVVWFDALKEHDWRIESSADALAAFRQGAKEWRAAP